MEALQANPCRECDSVPTVNEVTESLLIIGCKCQELTFDQKHVQGAPMSLEYAVAMWNRKCGKLTMEGDVAFIERMKQEAQNARRKFPDTRRAMLALMEEVGELAKSFLEEGPRRRYDEAVQVAVMAMRIAVEGDEAALPEGEVFG